MAIQNLLCFLISITVYTSLVSGRVFGGLFQSAQPCPSGTKVSCMISPCTATSGCRVFPDAECRNNYCGGCNAEFWVGSREVTAECDGPIGGDVLALSKTAAEPDCPPMRCFMNPCEKATCPAKPSASCRQHKCQCSSTFWEGNTEVTDQCTTVRDVLALSKTAAEPDCPPMRCFMNPCEKATCPAKPSASCRQHKCQCSATFWEGNTEVTDQCTASVSALALSKSAAEPDCPPIRCFMNPCDRATCLAKPSASCRQHKCQCSATFWEGSTEVTDQCTNDRLALNSGGSMGPVVASRKAQLPPKPQPAPCLSSCFFPPCRLSYCAAFPNAECRDNYCGGCRAQYYMGNTEVTKMCNDRVPTLGRLFSGRRRQRTRSIFSPWMAFLDGMF